jgi:transcriptional regulator with XRE-family HTH domain
MNNLNDVVKMTEVLPLALLELRAKIATAKHLHPERMGTLYARYCCLMRQIREEKDLSIEELSALSGSSVDFLEAAESLTLEMTEDDLKVLHDVYCELATGEDNPGDFKRLANQRLATPYPEIGSTMREIRQQKELSIKQLSTLSGFPEDILVAAESENLAMIGDDLEDAQRVYWFLSALEASPVDYRRHFTGFQNYRPSISSMTRAITSTMLALSSSARSCATSLEGKAFPMVLPLLPLPLTSKARNDVPSS